MDHLMRSMLFVSANNQRFIEKAEKLNADALILDLEDSVPEGQKNMAREIIADTLANDTLKSHTIFVRTNEIHSVHFMKDLDVSLHTDITGIMPPKIESREDLVFLDKLLTQKENEVGLPYGHFKLAPLIETSAAVLDLGKILEGQNRVVAICFGGEDYLNDIHGTHGFPPLAFDTPRALIAMAARTYGISPIDTPYLNLSDTDGFIKEKRMAYELGFEGSLLINPRQIELAHKCFMPSDEEIEQLQQLIESVSETEKSGENYGTMNGQVVGYAKKKRALKILKVIKNKKRNGE